MSCAHQLPVVRPTTAALGRPAIPQTRIRFAFDSARLQSTAKSYVVQDADWLQSAAGTILLLEGHADAVGSADYNLALGDRRARAVAAGLVAAGADPARIAGVVSLGETQPAAPGASAAARAANRRVEIVPW